MANPYIVECPICHAEPGEVCRDQDGYTIPVHPERKRVAWPGAYYDTPPEYPPS